MVQRRRLDAELVRRHLATGRTQAQELIRSGSVTVNGMVSDKPARQVLPTDSVTVLEQTQRYASRGAHKLLGALEAFGPSGLAVTDRLCLDAGASTGGFTDVLLRAGASHVIAVDVGYGQLRWELQQDPRVTVMDRTNVRSLKPVDLEYRPQLIVADLSFISLTAVMEVLLSVARPGAWLVLLVKPQFECGRAEASRGRGVVRDPEVWVRTLETVMNSAAEHRGVIMGAMVSPLRGGDGNVEFLVHVRAPVEHGPRATGHEGSLGSLARTVVESVPAGGSRG